MTSIRRLPALLLVPALTMTIAACGGGDNGGGDKGKIETIIKDTAKNPVTLCDHMAPTLLKQLGGKTGCAQAAKTGKKDQKVDIKKVDVKGKTATATIDADGQTSTIKFVKSGDDWQVSG